MSLPQDAEVVVIGAGPAGAAAACRLARAGADVLLLERGRAPDALTQRESEMLPQLRLGGAGATIAPGLTLQTGTGPGGGSVMSLGVCSRIPPTHLHAWGLESLLTAYDDIEALLSVRDIPEGDVNLHNARWMRGGRALSYRMTRLRDNRQGCIGAGFCALGCAQRARLDAARVLLPDAIAHGARLVEGAQVTHLQVHRRRVSGVEGLLNDGKTTRRFSVRADRIVLAAGALASSVLAAPHARRAGHGIFFHPTARVLALFPEPIEGWRGIPRSVACEQFSDQGIWLSPAFDPPATLAGWLPGSTEARSHLLGRIRHLGMCEVVAADDAVGQVSGWRGKPRVRYKISPRTGTALAKGVTEAARLWMAAGARRVVVPWSEPAMLNTLADAEMLRDRLPRAGDPLLSVWPGGGLAVGKACDAQGRVAGITGLYAADTSLLPQATATPPMLTAYALGWSVAGGLTGT